MVHNVYSFLLFLIIGYNTKRVISFMINEKVAHLSPYDWMASSPQFRNCRIVATPGIYGTRPTGIAYQKDSPYVDTFDYYIERMRASGIIERIKEKYKQPPQICPSLR